MFIEDLVFLEHNQIIIPINIKIYQLLTDVIAEYVSEGRINSLTSMS